MNNTEEILVIANELANEGKKPSVALIKTRLTQTIPLPTIISVLKNWQHQPDYSASTLTTNKKNKTKDGTIDNLIISKTELKQAIEQAIEQAIAPLKQELHEIKQLLKQVKN